MKILPAYLDGRRDQHISPHAILPRYRVPGKEEVWGFGCLRHPPASEGTYCRTFPEQMLIPLTTLPGTRWGADGLLFSRPLILRFPLP
jgi:hypothetical protein